MDVPLWIAPFLLIVTFAAIFRITLFLLWIGFAIVAPFVIVLCWLVQQLGDAIDRRWGWDVPRRVDPDATTGRIRW